MCEKRYYCPSGRQVDNKKCNPARTHAHIAGRSTPCPLCPAGEKCLVESTITYPCEEGEFSEEGVMECVSCELGSYSGSGARECTVSIIFGLNTLYNK